MEAKLRELVKYNHNGSGKFHISVSVRNGQWPLGFVGAPTKIPDMRQALCQNPIFADVFLDSFIKKKTNKIRHAFRDEIDVTDGPCLYNGSTCNKSNSITSMQGRWCGSTPSIGMHVVAAIVHAHKNGYMETFKDSSGEFNLVKIDASHLCAGNISTKNFCFNPKHVILESKRKNSVHKNCRGTITIEIDGKRKHSVCDHGD